MDGVSKGGQSLTLSGDITRQFSHTFSTADVYTVKVEFTDSDGDSDSVSWTVYVNRPPSVARVSPSTSSINLVVGDSQTFSARATDADSNISEWEWFVDDVLKGGQSLSFTGDITREFSHTFSSAGTYTVEVEFIDDLLESDSVSWTVRADEDLEQVSVTVASNTSGRTVTVDGTDRAAPYTATWDSGSSHTLNVPSPQNISGVNSRYVYSSWSQGGSQSQTVAPTSDATYTANFTQQHFLSTRSTPTGPGVAGGGQWYDHNSTAFVGPAPTVAGYNFSYWRKDFQNIGTDPAGVSVTVDGPTLVEAVFTPAVTAPPSVSRVSPSSSEVNLDPGDSQTFSARATDADNNISQWEWFLDGVSKGGQSLTLSGDITRQFSHTFSTADVYTVKVEFTDSDGDSDSVSWTVYVNRPPSVARVSPSTSSINLVVGDSQTFSARATDADSNISEWEWFVDDVLKGGQSLSFTGDITREFSHTFSSAGTYTVEVEFTDDLLESDSVSWTVHVEPNTPSTVTVGFGRTYQIVRESDGSVDIPVTISASPVEDVAVILLFDGPDDTADINDDFSLPSGRYVTFDADTTTLTQNITVTILDSVDVEFPESFFAVLQLASSTPPFASIPESNRVAEVEIIDDDTGTVGFVDDEVEVNEGDSFRLGIGVSKPAGTRCPIQFPIDVHFSYTDPDGALSPIATSAFLEHVSGNTYKALFNTCKVTFYFNVDSTRDVSADAEAEFTLDSLQHPDGTQARPITIGSQSTMTVKVLDGERPTGTVSVTFASRPSGRTVTVDGTNRTAPYTATWNSGSSHTLNVPSPQNITGVSSRYAFSRWSHGGSRSQTVSPTSNSTYTANFTLQHFLSTRSTPTGPGVAGGGQWYNHSSTAFVGPAPTVAGYNFSYWRKDFQNIGTDPAGVSVTVDGPTLVEAVFTPAGENRAPTIADDFSPSTESVILFAGRSQTFEARATDPDGNISSVVWHVDDLVVWDPGSIASIALTGDFPSSYDHTFSYPDTFMVKVTFTDAEGATASHTWTVQADPAAEERAPTVVRIVPEEEEISLYTTQTQDFTVEATDVNGDIVSWKWVVDKAGVLTDGHEEEEEFDEETGSITKEFSHPFDDDGTYTVTVTFTDSEGESGSVEWEVEVTDGPDLAVGDLKVTNDLGPYLGPASYFLVDAEIRNDGPIASGAYVVTFYIRNTGKRLIPIHELERTFTEGIDIPLTVNSNDPSDPNLAEDETKKISSVSLDIPDSVEAGPHWLCVQIQQDRPAVDQILDPKPFNNNDCTLTYIVSSLAIAEFIRPVAPSYLPGNSRFWLGVPIKLFEPTEIEKEHSYRILPDRLNSQERVELYRAVALEIATRKALIENQDYLPVINLKEFIDTSKDASFVMGAILAVYKPIHNVVLGASRLLSSAGVVLGAVDFLAPWFDLYTAMQINRSINIDDAFATLAVLEKLPIDNEFDGNQSEWQKAVMLAKDDVLAMTDERAWKQATVAAKDLALELIAGSAKYLLTVLGKAGLVVKGVALGSAAVGAKIFASFAVVASAIALIDHWDNLGASFMAAQVYVELYDEEASGDHLEVQTYAKYVVYDRAYQAEDNWLATVGSILRGQFGTVKKFKEKAAALRDAALEEARATIKVA